MIKFIVIITVVLLVVCGPASSAISYWKTNDDLSAKASGGDSLAVYADMTKVLGIDDKGVNKVYDAKLAASDVKEVSMTSSSFLILVDDEGETYTTSLEITDQLVLPEESNVVMNHDGQIIADANDPSKPKVVWLTSLEFPTNFDLDDLGLGSNLEQMSEDDLEILSAYCEENGVGYAAGCNIQYTDSNAELGIICKWGEREKVSIGG